METHSSVPAWRIPGTGEPEALYLCFVKEWLLGRQVCNVESMKIENK